jgi:hypothetical protein
MTDLSEYNCPSCGVDSNHKSIVIGFESKIAELKSNILMLEQYNGSVESLIKDIKSHNLEQQAKGAIKLTNVAMKKLQSPKCSQSRLEYFKAGVRALAFAIDKESKALKEQGK